MVTEEPVGMKMRHLLRLSSDLILKYFSKRTSLLRPFFCGIIINQPVVHLEQRRLFLGQIIKIETNLFCCSDFQLSNPTPCRVLPLISRGEIICNLISGQKIEPKFCRQCCPLLKKGTSAAEGLDKTK